MYSNLKYSGYFILIFLSLLSKFAFAQDYKAIRTDATYYFYDSSANDMIAIKIDSVVKNGNDVLYYNFPQIRPSGISYCHIPDGASWLGDPVIEKPEGIFLFKTVDNRNNGSQTDTLVINTQAILNQDWNFSDFPFSNDHIEAQVTAIVMLNFIGLTDSVKIISLTRKDASGKVVPDALNKEVIRLSKNYGLIRLPKFGGFNEHIQFYEITGKTNPITGNINPDLNAIFDFEVGDEIHTHFFSNSLDYSSSAEIWKIKRVTGKSISPANEWKAYKYDICYLKTTKTRPEWIPQYEKDHKFENEKIDLNKGIGLEFAKEPNQTFFDPASDWMISTTACIKHQVPAKFLNYNYPFSRPFPGDSCWGMIMVDGACDPYYIKGLGGPYYDCPAIILWYTYIEEIVYYKKGSVTWGTPLSCDSLVQVGLPENDQIQKSLISPNPTSGLFTITLPSNIQFPCKLEYFTSLGSYAKQFTINETIQSIDISNFPAGLYFYTLTSKDGRGFRGKIIKKIEHAIENLEL